MKYAWAVPGAKVVCIKRGEWLHPTKMGEVNPIYGDVLTIREVTVGPVTGDVLLTFQEIRNPPVRNGREVRYLAARFRPLRTVEDDVALFAHHLTPAPTDLTVA